MDKNITPLFTHAQAFEVLSGSNVSMVLADPKLPDMPIVYVNGAFETVTGYRAEDVIGKNCRFLQGADTDPDDVKALREALAAEEDVTVDLLNYRADGTTFMNRLMMTPIRDTGGDVTLFLGIQKPLTSDAESSLSPNAIRHAVREVQHRVKNHLSMITSLIRMYGRGAGEARGMFDSLARRVDSIQVLYQELSHPERKRDMDVVALESYLTRLAQATKTLDGRAGIELSVSVAPGDIATDDATTLGLIVSEVLTNSYKHGFKGRTSGQLNLSAERLNNGDYRVIVTDDGAGFREGAEWPGRTGTGGNIMNGLIGQLKGTVQVDSSSAGSTVTLTFPGLLDQPEST